MKPKEWVAKCHETDDWWVITQFPSGYYPRGETIRLVEKSAYDELKAALEFYADKDGENWVACRPDDTQYTCCHMIGEPSGGSVAREVLKRHS